MQDLRSVFKKWIQCNRQCNLKWVSATYVCMYVCAVPLLHGWGADLWEQAVVHDLNLVCSIWRTDTAVQAVESNTGHWRVALSWQRYIGLHTWCIHTHTHKQMWLGLCKHVWKDEEEISHSANPLQPSVASCSWSVCWCWVLCNMTVLSDFHIQYRCDALLFDTASFHLSNMFDTVMKPRWQCCPWAVHTKTLLKANGSNAVSVSASRLSVQLTSFVAIKECVVLPPKRRLLALGGFGLENRGFGRACGQ